MRSIRKIVRGYLFELFENNFPAGTVNDPSAPWNEPGEHISHIKIPEINEYKDVFFNREITILKNVKDNSLWYFYNETVDKEQYFPYAGVKYTKNLTGKDNFGDPLYDEEYEEWEVDGRMVQDYVNDHIESLKKGRGIDDYEAGVDLVQIDKPLAIELIRGYSKDERLKSLLSKLAYS
jgi:hypothetical protein